MDLTRERAWALLTEYTKSDSLLKHALAVVALAKLHCRERHECSDMAAKALRR